MVRASTLKSVEWVDMGSIPTTIRTADFENGVHSFPTGRSARIKIVYRESVAKFACCVQG